MKRSTKQAQKQTTISKAPPKQANQPANKKKKTKKTTKGAENVKTTQQSTLKGEKAYKRQNTQNKADAAEPSLNKVKSGTPKYAQPQMETNADKQKEKDDLKSIEMELRGD